jgi:hypothetical protein
MRPGIAHRDQAGRADLRWAPRRSTALVRALVRQVHALVLAHALEEPGREVQLLEPRRRLALARADLVQGLPAEEADHLHVGELVAEDGERGADRAHLDAHVDLAPQVVILVELLEELELLLVRAERAGPLHLEVGIAGQPLDLLPEDARLHGPLQVREQRRPEAPQPARVEGGREIDRRPGESERLHQGVVGDDLHARLEVLLPLVRRVVAHVGVEVQVHGDLRGARRELRVLAAQDLVLLLVPVLPDGGVRVPRGQRATDEARRLAVDEVGAGVAGEEIPLLLVQLLVVVSQVDVDHDVGLGDGLGAPEGLLLQRLAELDHRIDPARVVGLDLHEKDVTVFERYRHGPSPSLVGSPGLARGGLGRLASRP